MKKTALGVTFSKLIGFMIFILVLVILNAIDPQGITKDIVDFLNSHLLLIIIYSILFYLGELFELFIFPFNIPAPIFNSVGAVFLTAFIFQIFFSIWGAFYILLVIEPIIIIIVFLVVLIVGYILIFVKLFSKKEKVKTKAKKSKRSKKTTEWSDIGEEFKEALYNLGKSIKQALDPKK